jgi:hypothetical protein
MWLNDLGRVFVQTAGDMPMLNARRMCNGAANLVVLPEMPVRQYVLGVPSN